MAVKDQSAPDLLLALDRGGGRGLRAQLEAQLRDGVRAGRLREGTPLPSTRALAADLGVSRGVVVEAYAQLVAEGFLLTRPGGATRVGPVAVSRPVARAQVPDAPRPRWDMRVETGDLAAFPRRAWVAAQRRALAGAPDAALGYGDRSGVPGLRRALASYLGRARGVVADPDHVVITVGIMQAVALLAAVLREHGVQRVAVEHPGFVFHHMALQRAGLEVCPVPVDAGGLRVDAVAATDAEAVLVTPAHQFPTGAVLEPERRAALLAWAAQTGGYVLEDDYDGEFRYDRELGALQGLGPDRVIYLGSVSKTLAPALRLGWAIAPAALAGALREHKAWADGGSPALDQMTLASFIDNGDLDRHLRRSRSVFRRRRAALLAALAEHLPGAPVAGAAAGLHVTVELSRGTDPAVFLSAAWAAGAGVFAFALPEGGLLVLVGYANLPEASIQPAVRALAAAAAAGQKVSP